MMALSASIVLISPLISSVTCNKLLSSKETGSLNIGYLADGNFKLLICYPSNNQCKETELWSLYF